MVSAATSARPEHLNRDVIVDAALSVAEAGGVRNLSIRKVALHLGVTPMALYRHFGNKGELLAAALEAFVVRANVIPNDGLAWQDWVTEVGERMYRALCTDYYWVSVAGSVPVGAEAAQVTDAFVRRLTAAGFAAEQAVRAYFAVIQVVLGAVCLQASRSAGPVARGEMASVTQAYLKQPDTERLAVAPHLDRIAKSDQIDIGLPMIVAALEHKLSAAS